ncbi:MAG: glycosyltransferase [Rhodospirillales bacterium]|nr:glycosyltransferase [Rhodospirillales bacterium]
MRAMRDRRADGAEWEIALFALAALRDAAVAAGVRRARAVLARLPARPRRLVRGVGKLLWWSATLQLPRHLACFLAARRAAPRARVSALGPVPRAETIVFPEPAETPAVSVIVASYGAVDRSVRCLAALAEEAACVPMEVILCDDASPDPAVAALARVRGIRLLRNPSRLGYLRSVNRAAATARGDYLLLLNNDAYACPGALAAMLAAFAAFPEAGAVAAKLLFPDGRLQEAGGIVWADGSGWNWGRGEDPDAPRYNYARAVDYGSGAALMVRRSLFAALGGYDPVFAPAYFEDTDLAFRLRAAGHSVIYQPRAAFVHEEGVSYGGDASPARAALLAANRARFVARWGATLAASHYPNGTSVLRARERARHRSIVLVVDHYVPRPDRDAGSRNILNYIDALLEDGAAVKFWPHNRAYSPGYTEALQDRGVEVFHGGPPEALADWIAANGAELDAALLSRPDVAMDVLGVLKRHSAARLVYYGHDLHFRRLRRQAELTRDPAAAALAARTERIERWLWRSVDVALYPSEEEAALAAALEPGAVLRAVPAFGFARFGAEREAPANADLLFVGGFAHPPNGAAVAWFAEAILPLIRARVPGARLVIAGSHPGPETRALAAAGAVLHADLTEGALAALYTEARVAIAPLRFGAGVKLKVAEALREGTPLVTTAIGAEGLAGLGRVVAIADAPEEFAAAVVALLADDALWRRRSAGQIAYARKRLTLGELRRRFLAASGLGRAAERAAA